ncbi:ROK family protein [Streptomyces sp. MAR4 CNY-716]
MSGPDPVLALDIGGTGMRAAVVSADHRVTARRSRPTPAAEGADAVLAAAAELARAVRDDPAASGALAALGVGTAGVVSPDGRRVTHATAAIPGWAGTALADQLEAALGLPVTVVGDVQGFLIGEATAGAAAGADCAVGVMAGTGIGGAVWAGGRLLRGATGAAGHLGHIPVPGAGPRPCPCGRAGHVEAVASGPAMTAAYRAASPDARIADLRDVAGLAHAGDPVARRTLSDGGRALGTALAGVVATVDPQVVVLSGGVMASGPWYAAGVRDALPPAALPALAGVRVATAALGPDAVLVGAAESTRKPVVRPARMPSRETPATTALTTETSRR